MSESSEEHVTKKQVVYRMPESARVTVQADVEFGGADGAPLAMDVYLPPSSARAASFPTVVILAGYPDPGFEARLGCAFRKMASNVCWARLIAASGMAAVAYANRNPTADLDALFDHLRARAGALGIDAQRLGLWAASGNVPLALSVLMQRRREIRCAALLYGMTLDLDGSSTVDEGAKAFGYVNPASARTVADLPRDVPLFVARAGGDQVAGLNEALDRFVAAALACNLPLTFTNLPEAPHAFDVYDGSETSCQTIRNVLDFLQFHLHVR